MENLKFHNKDFLTFEEIETLIISVKPNEKAKMISNKLLNYFVINKVGLDPLDH